jgi:hypothetical protein
VLTVSPFSFFFAGIKGSKYWYSEKPLCVQLRSSYQFNKDISLSNNWMDGKDIDYSFIVEIVLKNLLPHPTSGSTEGTLQIGFYSIMAPLGVKRLRELVDSKFFDSTKIFRVVSCNCYDKWYKLICGKLNGELFYFFNFFFQIYFFFFKFISFFSNLFLCSNRCRISLFNLV